MSEPARISDILLFKKNASKEFVKPLCMRCDLCIECPVVNPLEMRACDLNDFASDLATWSVGGATGSDSSSEVFLRFEDCLAFGCPLRFSDLVVVAGL